MADRALARRDALAEVIAEKLQGLVAKAATTLEGLYLDPEDPNYNPDAKETWSNCSMKTRAALILCKAADDKQSPDMGRSFGVIILAGRAATAADWEAHAREVDEEERRKSAIDVEAVEVK